MFPQGYAWGFAFVSAFSFSKPSSWLNSNYTLCLFRSNLKAHSVLLSSPRLTVDYLGHRWLKHLPTMQVAFREQDSGLCLPASPLSETLSSFLVSVSAWTLDTDLWGQRAPHHIVTCPICRPLRPSSYCAYRCDRCPWSFFQLLASSRPPASLAAFIMLHNCRVSGFDTRSGVK